MTVWQTDSVCLENIIKDYGTNMPILTSTTNNLYQDLEELLDWDKPTTPPKIVKFTDDPVALSCASYRLWKMGGPRWSDIHFASVAEEDRVTALELKKYYRDNLVIDALKYGTNGRSEFRNKLAKLVIDELVYTDKEVGMLYRLPYFYEEDRALDRVVAQTETAKENFRGHKQTATYTLVEKVLRSRRSGEYYNYWLTSDCDQAAYYMTIKDDNPLRPMFESIIAKPVEATSLVYTKTYRGHHRNRTYYAMGNFELASR